MTPDSNIVQVLFPGPLAHALHIAHVHGYVVPSDAAALNACAALHWTGWLRYDSDANTYRATEYTREPVADWRLAGAHPWSLRGIV